MKTKLHLVILVLLPFTFQNVKAQVEGFWLVAKVTVGKETMTPVGKWIRMSDGKFVTGNGQLQHTYGQYTWTKGTSMLSFQNENEPADEFGAFQVSWEGKDMIWSRVEEDGPVKVTLVTTTELPTTPADKVKGLWTIQSAKKNDADLTSTFDPEKKMFLFLRWDRVFVWQRVMGKRERGFWFMNGHAPELTLVRDGNPNEVWTVSFTPSQMILTGKSENVKDTILTFQRLKDFPK